MLAPDAGCSARLVGITVTSLSACGCKFGIVVGISEVAARLEAGCPEDPVAAVSAVIAGASLIGKSRAASLSPVPFPPRFSSWEVLQVKARPG
jgi:hypothetical protein